MKKILVIEDIATIRLNISRALTFEGFAVQGAEDGYAGVEIARSWQPHLIICDIMMPRLDGYQTLAELRRAPSTADIAFIFLTAKGERGDLRLGMELGADDYIVKPFTNSELLAAVTARLERQDHALALRQQVQDLQLRHGRKDDFLTTASHELRTPLATMRLAIYLLKHTPTPEEQARYLRILEDECLRENDLVNNLLDLKRLESDQPLTLAAVDLRTWLLVCLNLVNYRPRNGSKFSTWTSPTPYPLSSPTASPSNGYSANCSPMPINTPHPRTAGPCASPTTTQP
ncbi:response regulator [Candidatus Cyanaurora vandensis]|uniref:hybrid sensor histidine kinase/response regulator n=1 Tax=Candidatus Cyanaurora vandensis TaxID=2714958 RepID=UPI0025802050|nr:response regulator [Candidatus Cyanaurora vandensis]